MKITVCCKVKETSLYPALDAAAALLGGVERLYFRERFLKHGNPNQLKGEFLREHGITARQLNGIILNLSGKVDANKKALQRQVDTKTRKLQRAQRRIKQALGANDKDCFKIHHYKRQVAHLQYTIASLAERIGSEVPSICFGARDRFREQFHLKDNGYRSHAQWRKEWRQARSSQFYCLGSKDEKFGNQTCQLLPKGLKLRLPNALSKQYGRHIIVPVAFRYREEAIQHALFFGAGHQLSLHTQGEGLVCPCHYGTHRCADCHREEQRGTRSGP